MGNTLFFAAANGFSSATYTTLFNHLHVKGNTIICKPMLAHDERFPLLKDWNGGKNEVIDFLEKNATEKVYGIGHSFGGVCTFKAAVERPDLFKGVILLDPVLLLGWFSFLIKIARLAGKGDEFSPAKYSKTRKTHWKSTEAAYKSLRNKGLYNNFEESCFQDYIHHTTENREDGCHLKFKLEKELEIYRTVPLNLGGLAGKCKVPVALMVGDKTDVTVDAFVKIFVRQHKIEQVFKIKGGHMFPLENTKETADCIEQILKLWE